MNIHEKYGIHRVINACGKMTKLAGAIVLPEIVGPVTESLRQFFDIDELQQAAGKVIASAWGSESGCVTACTSAGITLSVAACMTGADPARVLQLPDTSGMPQRVIIQKGHCVNYGAPITQSIRLSGATVVEVGSVNRCTEAELRHALAAGNVAAVVAVADFVIDNADEIVEAMAESIHQDYEWDWDYFRSNDQWRCRGVQTGQFADNEKCRYKRKDDDRWPD